MIDALSVSGLGKVFRRSRQDVVALDDVSFAICEGEVFGLIGPNGAGKSTLIKIINGLISPDAGSVLLHGKAIGDPSCRKGVAYVPENAIVYDCLTPIELVKFGLASHGIAGDKDKIAARWIERLGLGSDATRQLRGFSKGMAQRAVLAHAFAISPRLLILDEPLSGLDPLGRQLVIELIDEYHQQGGTVLFSSHVLYDVERLANRFGLIHKGRMLSVQSPSELKRHKDSLFRVRFEGLAEVAGFSRNFQNVWEGMVAQGDLWGTIERIKNSGGELIEVSPSMSLEKFFIDQVRM